jgi:hypothetical protein
VLQPGGRYISVCVHPCLNGGVVPFAAAVPGPGQAPLASSHAAGPAARSLASCLQLVVPGLSGELRNWSGLPGIGW